VDPRARRGLRSITRRGRDGQRRDELQPHERGAPVELERQPRVQHAHRRDAHGRVRERRGRDHGRGRELRALDELDRGPETCSDGTTDATLEFSLEVADCVAPGIDWTQEHLAAPGTTGG